MTTFFFLLGAALCSMCLAFNFHAEKFYYVAFGTPEPWFEQTKRKIKISYATWTLKEDGDMDFEFKLHNSDGSCKLILIYGKKTADPTMFTYDLRGEGPNSFQFKNEENSEYRLTRSFETKGDQRIPTIRLFATTKTPSCHAKEKMEALCAETGIGPENIVYLPENDDCVY